MVATYTKNGTDNLILIDLKSESFINLQLPIVEIQGNVQCNALRRVSDTNFIVLGSTRLTPLALYQVDVQNPSKLAMLKTSADVDIPTEFYAKAEHISFPIVYGDDRDGKSHALYLAPNNPDYRAIPGTLPPLVIFLHGGPTGHVSPGLSLAHQYYSSRGFAMALVNYAGSSGYGRPYRERLNGKWGISDIADVASCVKYLAGLGKIDSSRVGITGGSAGGYGTLQSLCVHSDMWAGGVSLYGIGNVKKMAETTHKFESHYLDGLFFTEDTTEAEKDEIYKERSPVYHAKNIKSPVLLLQGTEDKIVPPDQASEMEKIILENGEDVTLVMMEGEGHGFRMSENVRKAVLLEEEWCVETLLK